MSRSSLYGHSGSLFMSPFSCYFDCTNPKLPGTSAEKPQGWWKTRVVPINISTPCDLLGWCLMIGTLTAATALPYMCASLFISSPHLSCMTHLCATGFPVYSPTLNKNAWCSCSRKFPRYIKHKYMKWAKRFFFFFCNVEYSGKPFLIQNEMVLSRVRLNHTESSS